MSEANQQTSPASVVALMAMAEGPLNDILNRLHGSSLAKALAEGGYEIVITAKGNDTSPSPMPYFTNAVMVPTREHANDRAEIRRLQNEMHKANDMIEEQAGRIAKLEQRLVTLSKNEAIQYIEYWCSKFATVAAPVASSTTTDWAGRTQVVREPPPGSDKDPSGGPIRYIEITSIDGPSASGTWKHGDEHVFCRYTGRCLESSNGAMVGWMLAPHEMHRHCAKADGAGDNGGAS